MPATVFVLNYFHKNESNMLKCGKVKLKYLFFLS